MMARRTMAGALMLVAVLAVGLWLYVRSLAPQLELGVGYAARVACGCRFIGNRTLSDCRREFEPGMEPIRLSEGPRSVTAWVPLIASRTVRFDPILGCQPEAFAGTPLVIRR